MSLKDELELLERWRVCEHMIATGLASGNYTKASNWTLCRTSTELAITLNHYSDETLTADVAELLAEMRAAEHRRANTEWEE